MAFLIFMWGSDPTLMNSSRKLENSMKLLSLQLLCNEYASGPCKSNNQYADPVVDIIDRHRVIDHRLFRDSCTRTWDPIQRIYLPNVKVLVNFFIRH